MNTDKIYEKILSVVKSGQYESAFGLSCFHDECCALLRAAGAQDAQAERAYNYAYNEGHGSGLLEILLYVAEMAHIFSGE